MRIIVCGGRNYADKARVFAVLDELDARCSITHVDTGGARGADSLAVQWCIARFNAERILGGAVIPGYSNHYADWHKHGRAAGPIRNAHMLTLKPDLVVAFPGGPGTRDMIRQAKKAGVEVTEVSP